MSTTIRMPHGGVFAASLVVAGLLASDPAIAGQPATPATPATPAPSA